MDRQAVTEESCEKEAEACESGGKETSSPRSGQGMKGEKAPEQQNPHHQYYQMPPDMMAWPPYHPGIPHPYPYAFMMPPHPQYPPVGPGAYYQEAPSQAPRGKKPSGKPDMHASPDDSAQTHEECGCSGSEDSHDSSRHLKHDEHKFGQMFGIMNDIARGQTDPSKIMSLLEGFDGHFWKGALVGAAATLLLGSDAVRGAIAGIFSGAAAEKEKESSEGCESA